MYYILDERGNPVPEPDFLKWSAWFWAADQHIGDDHFGDIHISTIFLGMAHVSKEIGNDDVMLYETMVRTSDEILARLMEISETDDRSIVTTFFGGIDIQKRYATKEEAARGHKAMCIFVETCLAKGLLPL